MATSLSPPLNLEIYPVFGMAAGIDMVPNNIKSSIVVLFDILIHTNLSLLDLSSFTTKRNRWATDVPHRPSVSALSVHRADAAPSTVWTRLDVVVRECGRLRVACRQRSGDASA